jgi:hypothetical protein
MVISMPSQQHTFLPTSCDVSASDWHIEFFHSHLSFCLSQYYTLQKPPTASIFSPFARGARVQRRQQPPRRCQCPHRQGEELSKTIRLATPGRTSLLLQRRATVCEQVTSHTNFSTLQTGPRKDLEVDPLSVPNPYRHEILSIAGAPDPPKGAAQISPFYLGHHDQDDRASAAG